MNGKGVRAAKPGIYRLIDDRVCVRRLIGHAMDRSLENLALIRPHVS